MSIVLDVQHVKEFVHPQELAMLQPQIQAAHALLEEKSGPGKEFLGWLNLPSQATKEFLDDIIATSHQIRSSCTVLLVIGIGGSYLGAASGIEFLFSPYYNQIKGEQTPEIHFVGNNMSESHLASIWALCQGKEICINVISKSGTTTEPAIAFRLFRQLLEDKYGKEEAKKRIFATTDAEKGSLKSQADLHDYKTFVIPDNIGGRYAVLTPVGLLPMAVAGADIIQLLGGAKKAEAAYSNPDLNANPCYQYAALRTILHRKGKVAEVLVGYEPSLRLLGEWYKQLFGESEGKDHKGLFPASMLFSTDLHSLGQFVQEGSPLLFETVLDIVEPKLSPLLKEAGLTLTPQQEDSDGLNYLVGKTLPEINRKAMEGTILAHVAGGVPNLRLLLPDQSEDSLGQLYYFFMKACAISGYMLGVNPFDQPGVESYKRNMFALLGKSGYEDLRKELEEKLSL